MRNIREEELSKPITDFFLNKGYTVRCEVNSCDIAAVKEEELIVIELKKSLTVDLLLQAVKRQKISDLVYIAIPKPKKLTGRGKWRDICHLIKRLEIGLILVSFTENGSYIEIAEEPKIFNREKSINSSTKKRAALLKEFKSRSKDLNIGGSTGKKIVTAYREFAVYIACCLEKFGNMSTKELKLKGSNPDKTYSILYSNHYGWFEKVEKGVYKLSEKGKKEIKEFEILTDNFRKEISKF